MSNPHDDLKQQYELQALFDLSKVLNSSLNLNTILDTLLLTPMGKLLIGKGIVLIAKTNSTYMIETAKGLSRSLVGNIIEVECMPSAPSAVADLPPSTSKAFFDKIGIALLIPIRHDDKGLGLVGFGKKGIAGEFTDSDYDYLHSLSNIAATAIQNAIIFAELNTANRKLEKKVQELNTLSEIERELNSTLSTLNSERVVHLLAYSLMGELMVNRCLIFLIEDSRLILSLNRGMPAEAVEHMAESESVVRFLMTLREPLLKEQLEENDLTAELVRTGVSVLVPMMLESEPKGIIALGEKITKMAFVPDEVDFLSMLGNWSMISIETARLIEQEVEKKKLEEELRIASEIQKQLLPERCPQIPGFDVAAVNYPSLQVGGDYYDCIRLSDEEYLFCIADVSGKGAPAALLMSNLQASLHALASTDMSLPEITTKINNIIHRNTSFDKFITFFVGILNVPQQTFTSVNAGHNPPYLFRSDSSFEVFETGGLILGMMPNVPFEVQTTALAKGDCIVMFTDGISEAMNVDDEEFEEHRIEACLRKHERSSAAGVLTSVIEAVKEFSAGSPQADDITLLTITVA